MDKELLEYFISRTDKRFDQLERKLDTLLKFKWQIISGATVVSGLVAIAIQFIMKH